MSQTVILAILGSTAAGAVMASVVTGLFSKRKLGAEATKIITDAAAGVVTTLREETTREREARQAAEARLEKVVADNKEAIEKMASAHVQEREQWRRVLQLHVAWDGLAIAKMGEIGVSLPPAPPLLPPSRLTDADGYPIG